MTSPYVCFVTSTSYQMWPCLLFQNTIQFIEYENSALFDTPNMQRMYEQCCSEIVDKGLEITDRDLTTTRIVYLFGSNEEELAKYIFSLNEEIIDFDENYEKLMNQNNHDKLLNAV